MGFTGLKVSIKKTRSERHRWSVIVGLNASVVKGFTTTVLPSDTTLAGIQDAAQNNKVKLVVKEQSTSGAWLSLLFSFLPLVIIFFFFYMMMSQQGGGGGGGGRVMNFGKSKSQRSR